MSELRVINLLEDLCDEMEQFELMPSDKEKKKAAYWAKSGGWAGGWQFESQFCAHAVREGGAVLDRVG